MDNKIDLLREKYEMNEGERRPFLFFGRVLLIVMIIAALTGAAFSYRVHSTAQGDGQFPNLSLFSTIKHLVQADDKQLAGEKDDRINILLMGIGGSGHSGPQLTDTMIFASYQPSTGKVGMISIPRDLNVPMPGHGWRKINHANAFGEMAEDRTGPEMAVDVVEDIMDEEIHYFARVDFAGFAKFIDQLGGIDIYVERSFTDYNYPSHGKEYADCGVTVSVAEDGETVEKPDYSCRFETVTFEKGWTHMDGDTALKYVRSRHGTNGESSDFARSRRQQNVLMAVKDEVFSASTLLNLSKLKQLRDTLEQHIATNFETGELLRLAKQVKNRGVTQEDVVTHVLDSSPESPLYATAVNGAYVLLPKNDDWRPIQQLADAIFNEGAMGDLAPTPPKPPNERVVRLEIQNGTNINGLAARTSQLVNGQGFEVVRIGNAAKRGYTKTVIYDLTDGQAGESLSVLRNYLDANVALSATDQLSDDSTADAETRQNLTTETNVDFLIILGEDASSLVKKD